MVAFVEELTESYQKTSHLKEALNNSWVKNNCNYRCQDNGGNTVLHVSVKMSKNKLVSAITHMEMNINETNIHGDTALHIAAENGNHHAIESLLKRGASLEMKNAVDFTPLQVAAIKCQKSCVEVLIKYGADFKILTEHKETVAHLACRQIWVRYLTLKETVPLKLNRQESIGDARRSKKNFCDDLETTTHEKEKALFDDTFPCLSLLLEAFKKNPDLLEVEDRISTSPGTILCYFACFNYADGVKMLLKEPFLMCPNTENKNKLSPLWIASWHNHVEVGRLLVEANADPNVADPDKGITPLHGAINGYHIDRIDETCGFIEDLLSKGANPTVEDKSGETATHLALTTQDFRVMTLFIDHLGRESFDLKDSSGNTLFHYAVGTCDESSIFNMIQKGANLLRENDAEVKYDDEEGRVVMPDDIMENGQSMNSLPNAYNRCRSILIHRLPMQEAIQKGNGKHYFNAIRRLDLDEVFKSWSSGEIDTFICSHLIAAAKEVRPDIVRLLFQQISDKNRLHRILLYCDKSHSDETFSKTALEWAVENNDRYENALAEK